MLTPCYHPQPDMNMMQQNHEQPLRGKRIDEIDWLKFVFILLMIAFHLVYIGNAYPEVKRFVYTFHMPAFLLISGFMLNLSKSPGAFLRSMLWIAVPYLLVESGYIVMASILPIREHIDRLTLGVFFSKLFLHPLGPYWYLHTLVVGGLSAYVTLGLAPLRRSVAYVLLFSLYSALSIGLGLMSFANAMYLFAGIVLRQSGALFLSFFRASWLSVIPIVLLSLHSSNFSKSTLGGVLMVYFMMSLCLAVYPRTKGIPRSIALYIGRHTLLLLVFSPVFPILAKSYQSLLLRVEPTGMLFMLVSVAFAVAGSLGVGWLCDRLRLSRWIFGRERVL